MDLHSLGEFGLIDKLHSGLKARAGVRLGIGDDAAILETLQTPVITTDALIEGVHFRRDWTSPRALGRKAMAVNLSDLAASGAKPVAAFVALAVGPNDDYEFVRELYSGFEDMAAKYDFTVAGGDTVKSRGDLMLSITLIGEVMKPGRGPILRSGARVGDVLLVSGTLGDSAAGLALLLNPDAQVSKPVRDEVLLRHHEPTPQLELMRALLEFDAEAIHAALDLSDGLAGDAAHMVRSSSVTLQVNAEKIPISEACREVARVFGVDPLDYALSGGEDYELLLAVAPEKVEESIEEAKNSSNNALHRVGVCVGRDGDKAILVIAHDRGVRLLADAWTHF